MQVDWLRWFGDQIYTAVLVVSTLEGLGLPLPAELLYFPAMAFIRKGHISLFGLIMAGTLGNVLGSLTGFWLAYWGGQALLNRVFRLFGVKPTALQRMEEFFERYGQPTVFISRFVGVIRAATIYTAGAARMSPWRFTIYLGLAALAWNGLWVLMIHRFGHQVRTLLHHSGMGPVMALVVLAAVFVLGRVLWQRYGRKGPTAH